MAGLAMKYETDQKHISHYKLQDLYCNDIGGLIYIALQLL